MQILLKHRIITHIRKDSTEKRLFIWPLESAQTLKVKMDSVFLSLGCCNRISLNDWLENDRNLLCIIVEAGKPKARATTDSVSGETCFLIHRQPSCCVGTLYMA